MRGTIADEFHTRPKGPQNQIRWLPWSAPVQADYLSWRLAAEDAQITTTTEGKTLPSTVTQRSLRIAVVDPVEVRYSLRVP
jgi:hypothetical protein